jgi:hypothetical protein
LRPYLEDRLEQPWTTFAITNDTINDIKNPITIKGGRTYKRRQNKKLKTKKNKKTIVYERIFETEN